MGGNEVRKNDGETKVKCTKGVVVKINAIKLSVIPAQRRVSSWYVRADRGSVIPHSLKERSGSFSSAPIKFRPEGARHHSIG